MAIGSTRKTRILLLGPELGAVSGVSTHLNQLFGSQLLEDFDLKHFIVGSEGRRETPIQKLVRLLMSPFALAVRVIQFRPEIVHINVSLDHKSFPRDAVYLAIARIFRRNVVFQVHGGELPQNLYKTKVIRNQFMRRVLKAANVVVLLAQSELDAYSRFVPGVRLQVIPNGVVVDPRAAVRESVINAPLKLAYVGRLVPAKGVADCIAAARLLRDSGRDFKLTIAGEGPQEMALRAEAEILIEGKLIEFVGSQFGEDKYRLWQETDLFVFPTAHAEGLPYSLLESMASGVVPITTRVGAQPDVIEDGVQGLFVPPSDPEALFDAIVTLDDDRQRLLAMSQQCVLRILRHYSADQLSAQFGDLYRSLAPTASNRRTE
jgi:glycosyltransferase involved in cell wall biosynthesis